MRIGFRWLDDRSHYYVDLFDESLFREPSTNLPNPIQQRTQGITDIVLASHAYVPQFGCWHLLMFVLFESFADQ